MTSSTNQGHTSEERQPDDPLHPTFSASRAHGRVLQTVDGSLERVALVRGEARLTRRLDDGENAIMPLVQVE